MNAGWQEPVKRLSQLWNLTLHSGFWKVRTCVPEAVNWPLFTYPTCFAKYVFNFPEKLLKTQDIKQPSKKHSEFCVPIQGTMDQKWPCEAGQLACPPDSGCQPWPKSLRPAKRILSLPPSLCVRHPGNQRLSLVSIFVHKLYSPTHPIPVVPIKERIEVKQFGIRLEIVTVSPQCGPWQVQFCYFGRQC